MKFIAILAAVFFATSAFADVISVKPAKPQPTALKPGLAVKYFYPADVKNLKQAAKFAKKAKPGKPLEGLDYLDTRDGQRTLTSKQPYQVVADISGYVKFDSAGTYLVDFLSNDGVQVKIDGKEIIFFDDRHPCEESELAEIKIPSAGWYEIEVLYFQRVGTACLHMRAGKGEPDWMPNEAFGH